MNFGTILLGLWLILTGVFKFVPMPAGGEVLAVLALVAGILILVGR